MAALALAPPEKRVRNEDLAAFTAVPTPFLLKVMRPLVVAGLVDAKKGHHGGFRLARTAEEIRLADILAAVGIEADGACAFGWGRCNATHPCPLHGAWTVLKQRFDSWADETTLADVAASGVSPTRIRLHGGGLRVLQSE
jgi:Rrf2 family protein